MIDVSIIFVNYNTIKLLIDAIESVILNSTGFSYEIIVVDNNSTDDSEKIIRNYFQNKVVFLGLSQNIGFGQANNEGMKIAQGRNFFLLNPDTILINNAIKILLDYIDENPNIGAIGSNLYNEDGTFQPSFSHFFPSIKYEINQLFPFLKLLNLENINPSSQPKFVKRIVGAAMMIPKHIFEKTAGFDNRFFMYAEEDEWCFRLKKMNLEIVNIPQSKITHLDGKSFTVSAERKIRQLQGIRNFYKVCYSKNYCRFIKIIQFLTILSRFFAFSLLNKKENKFFWKMMFRNRKW